MSGTIAELIKLLATSVGSLYLMIVMLRFLLQASRADFYNPVTQAIVKLTSPLVNPLRRIIPGWRGLDFASLTLALLLNSLITTLLILAAGYSLPNVGLIISWSAVGLFAFFLNIYYWAVVVSVIISFIAPFSGHPVMLIVHQLLDPVYKRLRKVVPAMGGLDFSPLFIFLGIKVLEILLIAPLAGGLGLRTDLVIGI